jgi:ketol-acid reductoisomerase
MLDTYKAFGTRAALNYINDLTKGFFATKFIQEGEYWYGQTKTINEARREFALENVGSDAHELTGVLNKPK